MRRETVLNAIGVIAVIILVVTDAYVFCVGMNTLGRKEIPMGYPGDEHISQFLVGKTIKGISAPPDGSLRIYFTDGESFKIVPHVKRTVSPDIDLIVTPFKKNGDVKPTTEIVGGN